MKFFNICSKKTYEQNGETNTFWPQVGTLRQNDDGKMFIELNHLPGITYFVFEPKKKETTESVDF